MFVALLSSLCFVLWRSLRVWYMQYSICNMAMSVDASACLRCFPGLVTWSRCQLDDWMIGWVVARHVFVVTSCIPCCLVCQWSQSHYTCVVCVRMRAHSTSLLAACFVCLSSVSLSRLFVVFVFVFVCVGLLVSLLVRGCDCLL